MKKIKKNTAKWSLRETNIFYKAIEIYGLEFHLIALVFPKKDSKQLLKKYHKEFKQNQKKIEESLKVHESLNKDLFMNDEELKAYLQNVHSKKF